MIFFYLLGCDLNVLNFQPTASLAQLQAAVQTTVSSIERMAVSVISKFKSMWAIFTHGFSIPFMALCLKRRIHSFVYSVFLPAVQPHFTHHIFFRQKRSSSDTYHNHTSQEGSS